MFSQKLSQHFQHTWISVTWCEDPGSMKIIYLQLKMHSIGFTGIGKYFKSLEWLKISHCHVSTPWFTMLRALPCLEHQTDCVHQLPRHDISLPSKNHGEDPADSMHLLKFSSQTNALRNSQHADKISLAEECFLGTRMRKFTGNYPGYQHLTLGTHRQLTHQLRFLTMLCWPSPKVFTLSWIEIGD